MMARYLLDTSVLIDFSKGREPGTSLVQQFIRGGDDLGVCPINVAEFYAGIGPAQRREWDGFFASLRYWPISRAAAMQAGHWRYQFARQGVQLSTTDTLVAAVADEEQAVLVTGNVRDYPMGVQLLPVTT